MSKKKAAGNQVGQVPSPSLLQEGHVCHLEATRWPSAGLYAAVLLSLDFCFVFLTLQARLHLEDSGLGSLQSGITENVAAMEGKCCRGKGMLHNQDLVLLFW